MRFHKLAILILFSIFQLFVNGQPFDATPKSGCNDLIVNFTYTGPATTSYEWDFGDGSPHATGNGIPSHTYTQAGSFDVILITDNSTDTAFNFINIDPTPQVYFDTTTIIYASFTVMCRDTSVYENLDYFVWDFGDLTPPDTNESAIFTHKYESEATYRIWHHVIDLSGCKDSLSKDITISHKFEIQNAFSPNGDDINDNFIVLANGMDIFPETIIYNRWGGIVFKIENVSQIRWDGRTFDGSLVSPGAYFYIITPPANSNYEYLDASLKGTIQVVYK